MFIGVKDGPIRLIRGIQGAQSGASTTKYEFIYATQMMTRVNYRVHDTGPVTVSMDHDDILLDDYQQDRIAYVWSESEYHKPANDPLDDIDADSTSNSYPDDDSWNDWTEVPTPLRGSYVHLFREPRPICTVGTSYDYSDTTSRPGEFTRKWHDPSDHQDGPLAGNDGGCGPNGDPESESLLFARSELVMIPQPSREPANQADSVVAPGMQANFDLPVHATVFRQVREAPPTPMPSPPPPPVLSVFATAEGAANLELSAGLGSPSLAGFRVFRAGEGENFRFLREVRDAGTIVDATVRSSRTYRYRARSFLQENVESADSAEAVVHVSDTTPPSPPQNLTGTPGEARAILAWIPPSGCVQGVHVYMATVSGGPYTRLTGSPVTPSMNNQWVQIGLVNGEPYYFVVTAVDTVSNESGFSDEIVVIPGE